MQYNNHTKPYHSALVLTLRKRSGAQSNVHSGAQKSLAWGHFAVSHKWFIPALVLIDVSNPWSTKPRSVSHLSGTDRRGQRKCQPLAGFHRYKKVGWEKWITSPNKELCLSETSANQSNITARPILHRTERVWIKDKAVDPETAIMFH